MPSVLALSLSSALALPSAALATDWMGTGSGDWFTPGNWSSGTPTAGLDATIDTTYPSSTLVDLAGATALSVKVGATPGHTGLLAIRNGGTLVNTTSYLGSSPNSTGTVKVDGMGSSWTNTANLSVGEAGAGTLTIINGGAVSDQDGYVGHAWGSSGMAVVGTGSSWTNSGYFIVGGAGDGTVTISGGAVSNSGGIIGNLNSAVGTVQVAGGGSTWTNNAFLLVGQSGLGTLAITQGGAVSNTLGVVGEQASGSGSVKVDGNNSTWSNSSDLFIGFDGVGVLTVSNSGKVSSVTGYIGSGATGTGTVKVDGKNSSWTNTNGLAVGNFGSGVLEITSGGQVTGSVGVLGNYASSTGTVTVDGAASAWSNGAALYVGNQGTGTLAITGKGAVGNTLAIVGNLAGSTGSVTVGGAGSTWISSSDLFVGNVGTGTLSIRNNGAVVNVAGYIGNFGAGVATVDGQGSTWTNSDTLVVGNAGTGTLAVTNGGTVSSSRGHVGGHTDGNGSVVIDGPGSAWAGGTYFLLGDYGNGSLAILNEGSVSNAIGYLGNQAGSTGTASVSGTKSDWTNTGMLIVGNAGTGALAISKGGTVKSDVAVLGFSGTGKALVEGAGSAWTNAAELYVGYGGNGTLTIANGGTVSTGGMFVSIAGLAGSTGTLNIGGPAGAAAVDPGTLNATVVQFGAGTGTILFNHTDTSGNYVFTPGISGPGTVIQSAGYTRLTGDSSGFTGNVLVVGGRLAVNGSLANAPVSVSDGGILSDSGTVGHTFANAGGIVAPGNSIGTLNINGNITFAAGSSYQVEVDPGGNSDKLAVTGMATLNNGTVQVLAGAGSYAPFTSYSILTAAGGVTGTFSDVTSNLAFLTPALSYEAHGVFLTLTRNSSDFAGIGLTANQIATGAAAEGLGKANVIYDAVLGLSVDQARNAFDQLSGEVHASTRIVMLEDSRFVREAAMDRLRSSGGMNVPLMQTPSASDADGAPVSPLKSLPSTRDLAYWGRVMGSAGHIDGDGNAATVKRDAVGWLIGADRLVSDAWRVGLLGGYSRSNYDIGERNSSGASDNYHLGAYAGSRWGELALRSGVAYSWHNISTSRAVAIPGFTDSLKADYKVATTQLFGELGYCRTSEPLALEPFANLARVHVSSGGFAEHGGVAALSSTATSSGVTFSTLGVRASRNFALGGGTALTVRGSLGWRHAYGDTTPKTTSLAFAGGSPFVIAGVPITKSAAVLEAGLDFRLAPNAKLSLSYGGQFVAGLKDQSARVKLSVAF